MIYSNLLRELFMWKLTNEQKQLICDLYQEGETTPQLARKFGVSFVAICGILKRRKIKMRSNVEAQWQRKCKLNEEAFDIFSEESLYWLGFIFADGCITKRKGKSPELSIALKSGDVEHLYKFKNFLKATNKILYLEQYNANRFAVRSAKIIKTLEKYGITERKSFTVNPNPLLINSKHFWRGVIDGDGHIGLFSKYKYPRIELVGSEFMVKKFADFVSKNIIKHNSSIRKTKSIYVVSFCGNIAIPIIKYLYSDCNIHLNRKKQFVDVLLP